MEALCVRVCEFAAALIVRVSAPSVCVPAPVPAPLGGDVVVSVNVDTRARDLTRFMSRMATLGVGVCKFAASALMSL